MTRLVKAGQQAVVRDLGLRITGAVLVTDVQTAMRVNTERAANAVLLAMPDGRRPEAYGGVPGGHVLDGALLEMLRHLIDACEATLSKVAEGAVIGLSTLSSVLIKERNPHRKRIEALDPYVGVQPVMFFD